MRPYQANASQCHRSASSLLHFILSLLCPWYIGGCILDPLFTSPTVFSCAQKDTKFSLKYSILYKRTPPAGHYHFVSHPSLCFRNWSSRESCLSSCFPHPWLQ